MHRVLPLEFRLLPGYPSGRPAGFGLCTKPRLRLVVTMVVLMFAVPAVSVRSAGPRSGGTIHVATNAEPSTLDWTSSTNIATRLVAWHIYETLFAIDRHYDIRAMLADSYSVSADGLHYTVRLRKGVVFHNGRPMTADDVVASLERWGRLSGTGRETFKYIRHVTRVDATTILIDLTKVFTPLIANIGDFRQAPVIMPKAVAEAAGQRPVTEYVGTGPYMFRRWEQGHEIVLARNPGYVPRSEDRGGLAGKKVAYADEIHFLPTRDDTVRLAGVSTGQYHLALDIHPDLYPSVKANPHLTADIALFEWRAAVFNKAHAPFSDPRMRLAVVYAIKPAEILATGGPTEFWRLDPALFFPQQTSLYTTVGGNVYNHHNLRTAQELMKEAGYTGQKIVLMVTKDIVWQYNLAQVLVPQLQSAGFSVDEQVYDFPTLLARRVRKEGWDLFVTGFTWGFDPSSIPFLSSSWPGFYESRAMNALLDKWVQTPEADSAGRRLLMEQIQSTFYKEVPVVKFGNNYVMNVRNEHLHGYTNFLDVRLWNSWVTH